ncbi:MAG: hypothetical protein EOM53_00470 [Alphaproteobacteria bacterium]|nr:hypothetical protein [Alphaproteobacteria bacterium]
MSKLSKNTSLSFWQKRVLDAEKKYYDYHNLVDKTRKFYKDSESTLGKSGHYNIFWSSVETLKPFLYFKCPEIHIKRLNKEASKGEKYACKILEKALKWSVSQADFDSVLKYARNDFLISGMGLLWERYQGEFTKIDGEDIKVSENVLSQYVDPSCFIADCDNVGIWEDVTWVARRVYMSLREIEKSFGKESLESLQINLKEDEKDFKSYVVYEVWDKVTKKVYWFEKNGTKFFKVLEDPLHLKDFFPCPKPLFATLTNDSIIPIPDYILIKELLDELNGVNYRMRMITQAFKVSGAYDGSFPDLQNILEKENVLVALKDFIKLKENGGIKGVIDFIPLEQYVAALSELAERRKDIMMQIYNITGISDIMRGASNPQETATAVVRKTNFGNLRNQDRQNDMQRFIADLYRLKAEMIAELFSKDLLLSFLSKEERQDEEASKEALRILREEKIRQMSFLIGTDGLFNQEEELKKTSDVLSSLNGIVQNALQNVSVQPLLLLFYKEMVDVVAQYLPKARSLESVIESTFDKISKELSSKENPGPNLGFLLEQEKLKNTFMIEKEKLEIKRKELLLKENEFKSKRDLTQKEMALQAHFKTEELKEDKKVDSNISTGFVKDF